MGMFLRKYRKYMLVLADVLVMAIAFAIAAFMVYDAYSSFELLVFDMKITFFVSVVLFVAVMYLRKEYDCLWEYASIHDYAILLITCGFVSVISLAVVVLITGGLYYLRINCLSLLLSSFGITLCRIIIKAVCIYRRKTHRKTKQIKQKRVIIIGAGNAGARLLSEIKTNEKLNYKVIGFIDDDVHKIGRSVYGEKVLGGREEIEKICIREKIDIILFAIPSANNETAKDILEKCSKTGCRIRRMKSLEEIFYDTGEMLKLLREVNIEDLLSREKIELDNSKITSNISGKTVLVTGGGGSIGSELCRQIAKYSPKRLVIFDIYENNAYDIQNELKTNYRELNLDVIIGSVRDMTKLRQVFEKYKPEIVFHAAAHKHVPLMEDSPGEAIKNNVFGTYNTALCAHETGCGRFVLISTDKAVNPTNIMGASKRLCEMIVQAMQKVSETDFVAVRFGNVLGSNGSVIPLFKKQIEAGGPVTVTHKEITRFFMTIPEAASLVLQAASYAEGGEIFVLDMGQPVKIYDLAKNLIEMSGYTLGVDMKIEFTGLRPGEKLYEELLMAEEGLQTTAHSKIFIGKPVCCDYDTLLSNLKRLESVMQSEDDEYIKEVMSEIVPTYVREKVKVQSV